MDVLYILLFIQVIPGHPVLYQPLEVVSIEVNSTATIPCVSSEDTDRGHQISWYRRKWISNGSLRRVTGCITNNERQKYTCSYTAGRTVLLISNVQTKDSGAYFCTFLNSLSNIIGNGTYLSVGDRSTSRSSVHLLTPLQPAITPSSLLLACVVQKVCDSVHITWNISGKPHKGFMSSKKEPDGTWTFMNFISLSKDAWKHGEMVSCEVWLHSSPSSVSWIITEKKVYGDSNSSCQSFWIPVVTIGILYLLALAIHLIRSYITGPKTHVPKGSETQDDIVYSELILPRKK
ncbi:uncharacterized protein [Engystomops pustulosus]|uniref:uncharacterized protein n=1 Tax=Engystomops pustulosus TaxID=76066 RepID=UPI003AFA201D